MNFYSKSEIGNAEKVFAFDSIEARDAHVAAGKDYGEVVIEEKEAKEAFSAMSHDVDEGPFDSEGLVAIHTCRKGMLSVEEAAGRLNLSSARIYQLVSEGVIDALRIGRKAFALDPGSVDDYAQGRRPAGRPRNGRGRGDGRCQNGGSGRGAGGGGRRPCGRGRGDGSCQNGGSGRGGRRA